MDLNKMSATSKAIKHRGFLYGGGIIVPQEFSICDDVIIRPADISDDIEGLIKRATSKIDYGFLCALSETITFELELIDEAEKACLVKQWNSQWVLIFLSIICDVPISFPFHGQSSLEKTQLNPILVSRHFISTTNFIPPMHISVDQLELCSRLYDNFYGLLDEKRFSHAAAIASTNYSEPRASVRIASIWSAIEALLGLDHELRFRISLLASRLICTNFQERALKFKNIKKLYDDRSKCVHGAGLKPEKEKKVVEDSLGLLRELLLIFIEKGSLPTREFLDEELLRG